MRPHSDPPHLRSSDLPKLAPRAPLAAFVIAVATLALPLRTSAQSLIEGVDSWADATVGMTTKKWVGPRVPFPAPSARPASVARLDSTYWPISVHIENPGLATRARRVLEVLEQSYALLSATGWIDMFGDGGTGGTGGHDLYMVASARSGADAAVDSSIAFGTYDTARAFALLDERVPDASLAVCATQALVEALLYEVDPAEAESVRKSSAAFVAYLTTGELGCDDDAERALARPDEAPFRRGAGAEGAVFLARLSARQDRQTGVFVRDLWQFARQRTWEGTGLRASPSVFECLEKALDLAHEHLEDVAGELAEEWALASAPLGAAPRARLAEVTWDVLPEHLPASPPLGAFGSTYALVHLGQPRPGERLRVWSKGELGARWALSATKLDARGQRLGRVSAPPRKNPNSFVVIELDAHTQDVLVSLTNVGGGIPDPDGPSERFVHAAELIVDRGD